MARGLDELSRRELFTADDDLVFGNDLGLHTTMIDVHHVPQLDAESRRRTPGGH